MKLSEILKDWPEKKDNTDVPARANGIYRQREIDGFNTALTSCDREIDREALARELFIIRGNDINSWMYSDKKLVYLYFAYMVISTMPTWLKRIE